MLEYRIEDGYKKSVVEIHDTELPTQQARLAIELVGRWGMVAMMPDGEDSSGRQKFRPSTPQELCDRACETASLLFSKLRELGWFANIPTVAELDDHHKKSTAGKKEKE